MKICLRLATKKNQFQEIFLGKDHVMVFGRSSSADVKVDDEKISGKHCQIYLRKDKLEVQDLDSKNGTYLNGIRIDVSDLFLGDEIKIGDTLITVEENNSDKEASAILTFAGEENNKEKNDLRLDFTGARIQNQAATRNDAGRVIIPNSFQHEVELRRKAKSKIFLSKQEIKKRHSGAALFASVVDVIILFLIILVPLFLVFNTMPAETKKSHRMLVFVVIEVLAIPTFILKNFKHTKFTFGEKLAGIQEIYSKQ